MRLLVLLPVLVLAAGGCAEAVQGPRVVASDNEVFYVRYLPWRDSKAGVLAMADSVCAGGGRTAVQEGREQWAWLDLRYVTFRCATPPAPEELPEPSA